MTSSEQSTVRRLAGAAVGGVTGALVAAALTMVALAPRAFDASAGWYHDVHFFACYVFAAVTTGAGGALVIARSSHPVGPILGLIALLLAGAVAALGWSFLAAGHCWPGVGLAAHASTWLAAPGGFLAIAVLPWFLRNGPLPPRDRSLAVTGMVATVVIVLSGVIVQQPGAPANPLAVDSRFGRALAVVGLPAAVVCAVVGLLALLELLRRSRHEVAAGVRAVRLLTVAVPVLFVSVGVLNLQLHDLVDAVALAVLAAAQMVLVLSVVVLTLRTWDQPVGPVVPRVAVRGLLSAIVVAAYVGVVGLVSQALPIDDRVIGAAAVAVLALLVDPLRRWLQHRVDLLVHGAAADPEALRTALAADLHTESATDALERVAHELRHALRLGATVIRATGDPEVEVTAGRLRRDDPTIAYDLVVRGRRVGELVLQGPAADPITLRARRTAHRLTDLVAMTLDLAQAELRLRVASQRLGQVRTDAQRRIRRELHDGMGPMLAGVGLGLAAAQRRLQHDPEAAGRLIDDLRTEITRRSDGVRRLAHSLLPAELEDGDLRGALSVLAARFSGDGLRVRVDTSGLGDLDAPRLVACYHVAAEALLNAHRHADASSVDVRVSTTAGGAAVLEVVDDGGGIASDRGRGIGLTSMRERAEELGGRLEIGPGRDGRGTRIGLELP